MNELRDNAYAYARRLKALPFVSDDVRDAMECLEIGFRHAGSELVRERYATAIRSLGEHVLEQVESRYEPQPEPNPSCL